MTGLFEERCQFENTTYRYLPPIGTLRRLRRGLRRLPDRSARRPWLGAASRFAPGDTVRILDRAAIQRTLDARGTLRGLAFTLEQWAYCGGTFTVESSVRRLMDDRGVMRPIARSVTLAGVLCDGPHRDGGCGRACPLIFRDEWLEPAPESRPHVAENGERFARIKSAAEILATLDGGRRRDGVLFSPAMERFAGGRYAVYKQVQPVAATWWRRAGADWFVLSGLRCSGELLGPIGPCDRGCSLIWHRDWLDFED